MGRADFFKSGDWNAVCDQCGAKYKASDLRLEWDKLRVCDSCLDPRHPQELVRPVVDPMPLPWSRPDSDIFIAVEEGSSTRVVDGSAIDVLTMG